MVAVTVALEAGPRLDVALSGSEPVALLITELAPMLGVTEQVRAWVTGRPLSDGGTLTEQGVRDGAVITLSPSAEELRLPVVRADPAAELAERVSAALPPWRAGAGWWRWWTTVALATLACAPPLADLAGAPAPARAAVPVAACVVALAVVWALPAIALALVGPDPDRCRPVLVTGLRVGGGVLAAGCVGAVHAGVGTTALAGAVALLVGLRGRRFVDLRMRAEAWTAAGLGLLVVGAGALAVWPEHWWGLVGGVAALAGVVQAPVPGLVRRRAAEVVETCVWVALPPLVAVAAGLIGPVRS